MAWEKLGSTTVGGASTPVNNSWKEIGRTTLGSDGDTIDVTGFAAKDNLMILNHIIPSGVVQWELGLGSAGSIDTGNNYATRIQRNGSELTRTSQDTIESEQDLAQDQFAVLNLNNVSAQEKLCVGDVMLAGTSGAGNAPNRCEIAGKWANTSAQINSARIGNAGVGDMASGSEVVILGCDNDEADSGTNFWQELADVELSGTGNLDSGTFTAKKYLCFQTYSIMTSGNDLLRFNEDSGSNYSDRKSSDGGTDATRTSQSSLLNHIGEGGRTTPAFTSWYVVNVAAKEKLTIGQTNQQLTAGAGNAPTRLEVVGKWSNTSDQITRINAQGNFASGSRITVWGAD